ncbi:MAG: M24 family metallopeptidase [Candidatus Caldatribacteriaceae bacterium]
MNWERRVTTLTKNIEQPFLVTHPADIFYLSGFSGSVGFLLLFPLDQPAFFCDGRYTTQAREELQIPAQIVEFHNQVATKITEKLREGGKKELLVDEKISLALFRSLEKEGLTPIPIPSLVRSLRVKKDQEEVEMIKKALHIAERALERVLPLLKPGISEKDIAIELDYQIQVLGGEIAFPTIVAAGRRTALPHAHPSREKIQKDDWVLIDWGVRFAGYCADLTRTIYVGNQKQNRLQDIFQLVQSAQVLAKEHCKAGVIACQIDEVVRKFFSQRNVEVHFTHGLGHGVGIEIHEEPVLNSQSQTMLTENMVVTLEPGLYFPGWGGVRLESMVMVTKEGCLTLDRLDTF